MTFLDRLVANAGRYTDKVALHFLDEDGGSTLAVTYGELETAVRRTMAYLQEKGVKKGERVAFQLPKGLPFILLHLAVMRLEAISLPLNPGYPRRELRYYLEDAAARLLFVDRAAAETVRSLADELDSLEEVVLVSGADFLDLVAGYEPSAYPLPQEDGATCLMIYTSGTTGRPKGAQLSYRNLTANLDALHEAWGWQPTDRLLHVLPIFHVHGLIVALHGALNAGASVLLLPAFEAELTLDLLQAEQCTVFMAVPTIHRRLVDAPNADAADLGHMRLLTSGSDRLPDDLFARFRELFGYTLLERYGMSETGMLISNPLEGERRVGSVGLPLPGVEVRIVDPETEEVLPDGEVGAVQVRGANVCQGYWRKPEKTAEAFTADGWLRTGDLGLREPDGYFTLKGRAKDLVISGGYNIYPPEVELVLAEHPAVADSAVVGCPDAEWGERVTAVIVLEPGHTVIAEEIAAFCRERLVNYKVPRRIVFVDGFPRNALGKVQKARLRKQVCEVWPDVAATK